MDKNIFENIIKNIIEAKISKVSKEVIIKECLNNVDEEYKNELKEGIFKDYQTKTSYEKQKEAQKRYYEKNKEKIIERQKNYYRSNKNN